MDRLIARMAPEPFDAVAARTLAINLGAPAGTVPSTMFPAGMVYEPSVKRVSQGLRLDQAAGLRRIPMNKAQVDRLLRPIRWFGAENSR